MVPMWKALQMFDKNMVIFFDGKLENLRWNYTLALEQNDPEGIHELRVGLKYLKAFFRLVEAINPDFGARKRFRNFKKIARTTSSLRDSQVQLELVGKMCADSSLDITGFHRFIKKKENDYRNRFIGFSFSNPLEKLKKSRSAIKKALNNTDNGRAEIRAQGRFYNLKNRLVFLHDEDDLRDEILHEVRKQAKEMHYTLEIIQSSFHILRNSEEFIVKISRVHKLLGKWHDLDVCQCYLGEYQDTNPPDVTGTLHGLADNIREAKEAIRKEIGTAFEEFSQTASVY